MSPWAGGHVRCLGVRNQNELEHGCKWTQSARSQFMVLILKQYIIYLETEPCKNGNNHWNERRKEDRKNKASYALWLQKAQAESAESTGKDASTVAVWDSGSQGSFTDPCNLVLGIPLRYLRSSIPISQKSRIDTNLPAAWMTIKLPHGQSGPCFPVERAVEAIPCPTFSWRWHYKWSTLGDLAWMEPFRGGRSPLCWLLHLRHAILTNVFPLSLLLR